MKSVGQILIKFSPVEDKYVSREFQSFGIHLSEKLDDYKHRSLYIKLAKTVHRSILEKALSFVIDSNARNKPALFMWKLKELKTHLQYKQSANLKATTQISKIHKNDK